MFEFPLGTLTANLRPLQLTLNPPRESPSRPRDCSPPLKSRCRTIQGQQWLAASLSSNLERWQFAPIKRPAWAKRMWYDRHGLATRFHIKDTPFTLRCPPAASSWARRRGRPGGRKMKSRGKRCRFPTASGWEGRPSPRRIGRRWWRLLGRSRGC